MDIVLPYLTIDEMINMIDSPNKYACWRIMDDNRKLFQTAQGSSNNHQAWLGGYFDHVQEIMNIGIVLFDQLNALRPLPFSLSDVLLVVFLHDIEKPWKYELLDDGQLHEIATLKSKQAQHDFRNQKIIEYRFELTEEQQNGMKYVEGENLDYSNRKRTMGPLAALCHLADVTSARIWHDHPLETNDSWTGAKRLRE